MKKQHERKPTRFDEMTRMIERDYAPKHSLRIVARRTILQCEAAELEKEILGLLAAGAAARERKAEVAAMILGLTNVLERRR